MVEKKVYHMLQEENIYLTMKIIISFIYTKNIMVQQKGYK